MTALKIVAMLFGAFVLGILFAIAIMTYMILQLKATGKIEIETK